MDPLIIVPAYNVEKSLSELLRKLKYYKENVLFVDDGSSDSTGKIIKQNKFNIITNSRNIGVSNSIMKGLVYAKEHGYSAVILMDADGQHDPKFLPQFIGDLNSSDFVFGCRFSYNSAVPTLKLNSNLLAAMIVNKIWGCNFLDISCGFKGFRLDDSILELFKKSSGYEIVFDMFFYALSKCANISVVKVDPIYDNSVFLSTRQEELIAFLSSLKRHSFKDYTNLNLDMVFKSIIASKDFTYSINNTMFYGFYISCKNTYIIQSDLEKVYSYIRSMRSDNDVQ